MKNLILAAVAAVSLPASAMAHNYSFEISEGFARSSNPKAGAAFMTIKNDSEHDCTLTSVTSPAANKVELHTSKENAEGMMEMLPIEGGITIPARGSHSLARGGDHIMLMDVVTPLKQGDEVALQLDFGECGKVDTVLPLDNERTGTVAGAAAPMKGEMKMDHGGDDPHANH